MGRHLMRAKRLKRRVGTKAGDGEGWVDCKSIRVWVFDEFKSQFTKGVVVKFGYYYHAIREYIQP